MLKTSFLFAFLFPLLVSGQSSDTLVVQNYRIFISDTLLARYTRWDQVADTVQAYSHKQLAVVFEQKQYLLRHGLKAEVLLKQQYPLTEWQLLAFYRNDVGQIRRVDSFDPIQIRKAEVRQQNKIIGGSALIMAGVWGISRRFVVQPTPRDYGEALGQGIGRAVLPVFGTVSVISGIIWIANSGDH